VQPDPADAPAARGPYAALQRAKVEKAALASAAADTARPATPPPGPDYDAATAYLSDTLDCMNPYWPPDAEHIEIDYHYDIQQNYSSPHP
jgi:hypothetical protein